jgi:hypothetical protein
VRALFVEDGIQQNDDCMNRGYKCIDISEVVCLFGFVISAFLVVINYTLSIFFSNVYPVSESGGYSISKCASVWRERGAVLLLRHAGGASVETFGGSVFKCRAVNVVC